MYEYRYRLWCKDDQESEAVELNKISKCQFFIQEQKKFPNGSIKWKHGIWGEIKNGNVSERQIFKEYTIKGKLKTKSKTSAKYFLEKN